MSGWTLIFVVIGVATVATIPFKLVDVIEKRG